MQVTELFTPLYEKAEDEIMLQDAAREAGLSMLTQRDNAFRATQGKPLMLGSLQKLLSNKSLLNTIEDDKVKGRMRSLLIYLMTKEAHLETWKKATIGKVHFNQLEDRLSLFMWIPNNLSADEIYKEFESKFVHELRHALDAAYSDRKFVKSKDVDRLQSKGLQSLDYVKFAHEINARFSELQRLTKKWIDEKTEGGGAVDKSFFFKNVLPTMMKEHFLSRTHDFPDVGIQELMSEPQSRRLLSRLSVFFDHVVGGK